MVSVSNNNYSYDGEGRLIKDVQEGIASIEWRVDGKVKKINRTAGSTKKNLTFEYDAMGHRIATTEGRNEVKHVLTSANVLEKSTYYILDAQGKNQLQLMKTECPFGKTENTKEMAVYERAVNASNQSVTFEHTEKHVYGSSRLGVMNIKVPKLGSQNTSYSMINKKHRIGERNYELSNHLGNVLSVISDKPIPHSTNGTTHDYYMADIMQSSDYSAFGVTLSGRNFVKANAKESRRGFNGMEEDDEIKGEGNSLNYTFRMHDPRLGRFLSVDPKQHPNASPYNSFDNNPIVKVDPDGKDAIVTVKKNESGGGQITISSTIHVVGKNITQSQIDAVQTKFNTLVKNGTYLDVEGNVWEVVFDVTFISAGDVNSEELRNQIAEGDNILELNSSGHTEGSITRIQSKSIEAPDTELVIKDAYQTTGNNAHVGSLEDSPVINHEILHLLGLTDRYENQYISMTFSNGTSVNRLTSIPDAGWGGDIMSSTAGGGKFGQAHYDNFGRAYSGKVNGSFVLQYGVDINQKTAEKIGQDAGGLSSEEKTEVSKTSSKPRF